MRLQNVDGPTIFNGVTVVCTLCALAWIGGGMSLVRNGFGAGSGYGAVLIGTGSVLCMFVPLALVLAFRHSRPRATELQRRTGEIVALQPSWWRWWWTWPAGIACIAAWVAGGAIVLHHGTRGITGAFGDPDLGLRCSTALRMHCISTSRAVVSRTDDDDGTTLWVEKDDRRVGLRLVGSDLPEDGTIVDLESRDGVLVSVRAVHGGRRWHTASWPRHWHTVARSLAVIAVGFVLLGTLAALSAWGLVARVRLRAQLRRPLGR